MAGWSDLSTLKMSFREVIAASANNDASWFRFLSSLPHLKMLIVEIAPVQPQPSDTIIPFLNTLGSRVEIHSSDPKYHSPQAASALSTVNSLTMDDNLLLCPDLETLELVLKDTFDSLLHKPDQDLWSWLLRCARVRHAREKPPRKLCLRGPYEWGKGDLLEADKKQLLEYVELVEVGCVLSS